MQHALIQKDFIVSSCEIGNSSMCAQDIENIKNWNADVAILSKPYDLAEEGYQELLRIGSKIYEAFPELLKELQEKDYLFLPGFGQRFEESAKAFIEGLNQNLTIEKVTADSEILAPYSSCEKYKKEVRYSPDLYQVDEEYKKNCIIFKHAVSKNKTNIIT
ncbi:hypothetical protein PYW08_014709 [Mythimna loreyi]|uniref:Uncharacterized protein n=1 Tax=Mythimna loreyi TaxID=667449 RepID=A0ACC2R3B2_9NEOP|nr:hypothetical protein PYW08_014709 [Mythimna loreyi]